MKKLWIRMTKSQMRCLEHSVGVENRTYAINMLIQKASGELGIEGLALFPYEERGRRGVADKILWAIPDRSLKILERATHCKSINAVKFALNIAMQDYSCWQPLKVHFDLIRYIDIEAWKKEPYIYSRKLARQTGEKSNSIYKRIARALESIDK